MHVTYVLKTITCNFGDFPAGTKSNSFLPHARTSIWKVYANFWDAPNIATSHSTGSHSLHTSTVIVHTGLRNGLLAQKWAIIKTWCGGTSSCNLSWGGHALHWWSHASLLVRLLSAKRRQSQWRRNRCSSCSGRGWRRSNCAQRRDVFQRRQGRWCSMLLCCRRL